jgi:hypothetical protein
MNKYGTTNHLQLGYLKKKVGESLSRGYLYQNSSIMLHMMSGLYAKRPPPKKNVKTAAEGLV